MAQWLRQFTGNTHQTKVKEREQQLRHAVDVLETKESPADQIASMQTVLRLAEQLHRARIRALRAQIASLDPRESDRLDAALQKRDQLEAGGAQQILREFQVSSESDEEAIG